MLMWVREWASEWVCIYVFVTFFTPLYLYFSSRFFILLFLFFSFKQEDLDCSCIVQLYFVWNQICLHYYTYIYTYAYIYTYIHTHIHIYELWKCTSKNKTHIDVCNFPHIIIDIVYKICLCLCRRRNIDAVVRVGMWCNMWSWNRDENPRV